MAPLELETNLAKRTTKPPRLMRKLPRKSDNTLSVTGGGISFDLRIEVGYIIVI